MLYLRNVQDADALIAAIQQCKAAGGKVSVGQPSAAACLATACMFACLATTPLLCPPAISRVHARACRCPPTLCLSVCGGPPRRPCLPCQQAVCIGGGYIGMECAAVLSMNGLDVTMVFPEDR